MIKLFHVTKFNARATEVPDYLCVIYSVVFRNVGAPWINFRLQDSALDYPLRNTSALNSINYAAISNIGQICRIRQIPNSCRILAVHPNHPLIAIKRAVD